MSCAYSQLNLHVKDTDYLAVEKLLFWVSADHCKFLSLGRTRISRLAHTVLSVLGLQDDDRRTARMLDKPKKICCAMSLSSGNIGSIASGTRLLAPRKVLAVEHRVESPEVHK